MIYTNEAVMAYQCTITSLKIHGEHLVSGGRGALSTEVRFRKFESDGDSLALL